MNMKVPHPAGDLPIFAALALVLMLVSYIFVVRETMWSDTTVGWLVSWWGEYALYTAKQRW